MGAIRVTDYRPPQADKPLPRGRQTNRWAVLAAVEVGPAAAAVILDLAIPTFVILALMTLSLLIRRQGPSTLGLHRVPHAWALAGKMLALAVAWTLLDVGLLKPIENHLTGTTQDMSQFTSLQGNLGMLLTWVALAWVVAGFGETLAFVGFLQTRITEVIGTAAPASGLPSCCPRCCSDCCTPSTESSGWR